MKKGLFLVLVGCFFLMVAFGSVQAAQPVKFSDFFSGRIGAGLSIGEFDTDTCIQPVDDLGGSLSLLFVAKRPLGDLPKGTYFGMNYNTDFVGNDAPLSTVTTLSAGWMNDPNSNFQVVLGVDGLFPRHSVGALGFYVETREALWKDSEDIHQSAVIFRISTMAAMNGDNNLGGFNARLGLEHKLNCDGGVSVLLEGGAGIDDGSYGRPSMGYLYGGMGLCVLTGPFEIKAPYFKGAYCSEGSYGKRQPSSRGETKFSSLSAELAYNFW